MKHFGWLIWWNLHFREVMGWLPHGREREVLKFLHRPSSLRMLARRVASSFPGYGVKVESIWVDGTPQATFSNVGVIGTLNCELADLLLLVRREQANGNLIDEQGLLLQAKITPRHNRLTSGNSTKLERCLLEKIDRALPLELHRNTERTSLLGNFNLGADAYGNFVGLKDCARYLLAPKFASWSSVGNKHTPYQVGWPGSYPSPFLKKTKGFVEAIIDVGVTKTLGRTVSPPGTDAWSDIVAALRGAYIGRAMAGYGHDRIHVGQAFQMSPLHLSMYSTPYFNSTLSTNFPPQMNELDLDDLANRPPALPIIGVTLRGGWPD